MNIFNVCCLFLWSISSLQMSAMNQINTSQKQELDDHTIHSAALKGDLELLKKLLNENALKSKDDYSRNALFYAILSNQAECVEAIFLAACSDMKVTNFEKLSSLNEKSAELLAEIIITEDVHQQSPYCYSQVSKNEKIRVLFQKAKQLLIQANIWDENHNYCSIF